MSLAGIGLANAGGFGAFGGGGVSESILDRLPSSYDLDGTTFVEQLRIVARDGVPGSGLVDRAINHLFSEAGTGGALEYGVSSIMGPVDTLLKSGGGVYLTAQNNAAFDFTTEDMAVTVIGITRAGSEQQWIWKKRTTNGLVVQQFTTDNLVLFIDAAVGVSVVSSPLPDNSFFVGHCFLKRDGNARWAVNGAYSGNSVSISTESGSITNTDTAQVMGSAQWDGGLFYFSIHTAAGGSLTSPDHLATHQAHLDLLTGF